MTGFAVRSARVHDVDAELGGGRVDAMVLDVNELGHRLWQAAGYRHADEWSRWVKPA